MPTPFEATNLIRQAARLGAALSPKDSAGEQVGVSADQGAAALGAQRLLDTPISQIQAQQRVGYAPGAIQASGLTVDELAKIYPMGLTAQMANEEARQFDARYPLEQQRVNNDTQQVNLNTQALPSEINLRAAQALELQGRPAEARALLAIELNNRLQAQRDEAQARLALEQTRASNDMAINSQEQQLKNAAMRLEQAFKLQQPTTVSPDSQALMLPNIGYDAQGNPFVNGFTPATVNSVPGDPSQDRAAQQKNAMQAWDKPDASKEAKPAGTITTDVARAAQVALAQAGNDPALAAYTGNPNQPGQAQLRVVSYDDQGKPVYKYLFPDDTLQAKYEARLADALEVSIAQGGLTKEAAAQYSPIINQRYFGQKSLSANTQTSQTQPSSSVSSYINSALGQQP